MPPVKHSRTVFFEEIAKQVPDRGSCSRVSPLFLTQLKLWLSFSDGEIATLLGVSRPAIVRKRGKAATEEAAPQVPAIPADQAEDVPAEFSEMPTEEKIQYITRKYDRCIDGKEILSKDQIAALKNRLEDLRTLQADQTEEGSKLVSSVLNVLLKDYVRNFKAAYEAAFLKLKVDMINASVDTTFNALAQMLEGREDSDKLKDEVINKLQSMAGGFGNDFDPVLVFLETGKAHPVLMEQVDKYLERSKTTPRLVGGSSIKNSESVQGGAQYRQQAKEERRADLQKGRAIQ